MLSTCPDMFMCTQVPKAFPRQLIYVMLATAFFAAVYSWYAIASDDRL